MEDKRNAYQILGTSRDAVITIGGTSKEGKEANQNEFLVHKRDDTLHKLERDKAPLIEQLRKIEENKRILGEMQDIKIELDLRKKIRKIEDEIRLVRSAYLEIHDQKSRQVYDDYIDLSIKMQDPKAKIDRKITENAYEILRIKEDRCDDTKRDSRKIDEELLTFKDFAVKEIKEKIKELQNKLNSLEGKKDPESYRTKSGIDGDIVSFERDIQRIEDAYAKVATRELREAYAVELEQIKEQAKERIRQSELRKKYKISQYYNPNSIQQVGYKSLEITEKERIKQEKEKKRNLSVVLVREDGTAVTVERIGMLGYKTSNRMTGMLDAYRITRTVNGEKKWDVRYTNLNMIDLSRNPKTGELQNKEYHDFVANVFLSEDSIEGTGYNAGYLGQALKDKDGNYVHDLKNVEELSAVMKFDEIKKDKEKKGEESKEGEAYEQ